MARVYVSSTISDLQAERKAVIDWLIAAGHQPVHSYTPGGQTVRDSCLEDVDGCDGYVLILGHRYGFRPEDGNPEKLSITHLEYRRAAGKPRIAMLRTAIPDIRLSDLNSPDSYSAVMAFRAEVQRDVRPCEFKDDAGLILGLSTGIQKALDSWAWRGDVATARVVSAPPRDPPPDNLKLVFNRSLQDQMLSSKLRQSLNAGKKVLACLLLGPTDESHSDFIARYQAFTLRDVCQLLRIRYSVSEQPLYWPEAKSAEKDRLPFLRNELGRLLGIADVAGLSDSELRLAVSRWVGQEQKHVVAVFHLNPYCSSDEALIESWLRFWEGLDLRNTAYSLTVFFCVYCERAKWRGVFRGPRVSLKRLKQKFGSVSEVVSLDELESPRESDVTVWVNTDCPRAWQLAGHGGEKLPLHLDELRMRTLESFQGRKSRPFEQLKGKLGDAIKRAYERYHREGSG